ncbi:murein transglycosylase domain-containing protein [Hydrogenothermus marinus]|uniref:Membrane-bound lytic murein transglycosylase C n=1 Tax=Hydrogenothermus marinus TaxID=133270 RepID=A0A3M0B632_9AQUI|nr:murein transglycosylase domain-containing protein [Hydrogenothermus marinus]RMA92507.1 membrane-bound lytic murein transglycosylase C [Hydrogenothermus marinus]
MKILIFLLLLLISIYSYGKEEKFQNYMKEFQEYENKEIRDYKAYYEQIMKEFEEYKKIVNEEFENYKKEISKYWEDTEISTKTKWVEYSNNYKIKKVVDFENGEIRIEIIDKNKPSNEKIKNLLKDLITEDTNRAFKNDKLSQNIEKKLLEKVKHIKTAKVDKKPILMDVIVQKENPEPKDISKAIENLIQKGELYKKPSKFGGEKVYFFKIKLLPKIFLIKIKEYKPTVSKYSKKYRLRESLIFAIIHTESAFNPLAKSPAPAYGLMQIVPQTAGKDATKIIYGKPVLLAPSYLYNSEKNIMVGTTYLYLLYYKYLSDIKNPLSRLYCTIAAYNTGAGNVARAFIGTTNIKKAIHIINKMTPSEVYNTLEKNLPYEETKQYLNKVAIRIKIYE